MTAPFYYTEGGFEMNMKLIETTTGIRMQFLYNDDGEAMEYSTIDFPDNNTLRSMAEYILDTVEKDK